MCETHRISTMALHGVFSIFHNIWNKKNHIKCPDISTKTHLMSTPLPAHSASLYDRTTVRHSHASAQPTRCNINPSNHILNCFELTRNSEENATLSGHKRGLQPNGDEPAQVGLRNSTEKLDANTSISDGGARHAELYFLSPIMRSCTRRRVRLFFTVSLDPIRVLAGDGTTRSSSLDCDRL